MYQLQIEKHHTSVYLYVCISNACLENFLELSEVSVNHVTISILNFVVKALGLWLGLGLLGDDWSGLG